MWLAIDMYCMSVYILAKGELQTQDTTIPSSQDIPWNNLRTATLRKDFCKYERLLFPKI